MEEIDADLLEDAERRQMDRLELVSFARSSHFRDLLHQRLVRLPHVIGVSIYDEHGKSDAAKLAAAVNVADDNPNLWNWIIFPPGFRAPAMMQLAKRQAWTLKPARLK